MMDHLAEGLAVFEELRRSSAYEPTTAKEKEKRSIFMFFWNQAAAELRERFGPTGRNGDEIGFGYLVEEMAKRSSRIPKNSAKGNHLADLILGILQTGNDALVGGARRLYNPDMIFVKLIGRRAEISGIAEVKSSLEAYRRKPAQILFQEDSIRKILGGIDNDKELGTAHKYFTLRKIALRQPLKKLMVVPAGLKEKFVEELPADWECAELEFTYEELTFIAKQLWPEFRPEVKFDEGLLSRYETGFLAWFLHWGKTLMEFIFADKKGVSDFPWRELFLFVCAAKKVPLTDNAINAVVPVVQDSIGLFWHYPRHFAKRDNLTPWQERFLIKFTDRYAFAAETPESDARQQALFFLTNLKIFRKNIERWCEGKGAAKFKKMRDFDILQH